MVQIRLTDAFRFVVVGAPIYLAHQGTPERPEDLLRHECITFRSPTSGALYAWELERGRRSWRVPVRGGVVASDAALNVAMAEQGLGLTYTFEPMILGQLRSGRLRRVLEAYAPTVPGFFLYFPSHARGSLPVRLFADAAKELSVRVTK
jgi:DNA-binding transcriptional LysR family regulator